MRLNPKLILLFSVLSGFLAFTFILSASGQAKDPATSLIVTAITDLGVGETIAIKNMKLSPAPPDIDLEAAYHDLKSVEGRVARVAIMRGRPITTFDLIADDENIFNLIPSGYRAATLPASLPNEILKLLKFGTRVDVLFTDTTTKDLRTKTIMKNAMVMKVSGIPAGNQNRGLAEQVHVTLAVPPDAVEALSYATQKGKVNLAVRPNGDGNNSGNLEESYMNLDEVIGLKKDPNDLFNQAEIEVIKGTEKELIRL